MNIILNRVDERLIHGQVLISWAKKLQARRILVIDEQLPYDKFGAAVLRMSVPADIELKIMGVEEGHLYIQENLEGELANTILLVRYPKVIYQLVQLGYHPQSINIGGMAPGEDRQHLRKGIYASQEEIYLLEDLENWGIEVYIQVVFSDGRVMFRDIL